jgi:hypothetical protein
MKTKLVLGQLAAIEQLLKAMHETDASMSDEFHDTLSMMVANVKTTLEIEGGAQ